MVERREKVRTKDNKKTTVLTFRRLISYIVLILMTFICLFPFYILIINATRAHSAIQQGFSFLPGKSLIPNWNKLMSNDNLPVLRAMFNSFFVAMCTALFATYFSALTAYAIHTYRFKIRKVALSFILMIMMVPTQVSALGFIRQMNAMGLDDSFIPYYTCNCFAGCILLYVAIYGRVLL